MYDAEKLAVKMKVLNFTETLREAMHNTFRYGQGTRDMSGPSGFTTEDFIDKVAWRLERYLSMQDEETPPPQLQEPDRKYKRNLNIDTEAVNKMFQKFDKNGDGKIDYEEFERMMIKLDLAPKKTSEADAKSPDV